MDRIINLENSGSTNDSNIKLSEWLKDYYAKDELETLFANMDSAMKYIHSKGYCVYSFNPRDIEILNGSLRQIRFNFLLEMPDDFLLRKDIVRDDIWKSSFLQIGIYSNCLNCMTPDFLKSNFNGFSTFLPEGVVPYYRGVVERNASVYLGDYLQEKRRRDLDELEKEVGESAVPANGKRLVKSNSAADLLEYDSMNSKINDSIYKKLSGISDTAFISFMMVPVLVAFLGIIFMVVVLLSR